jgi:hypothetical protein
MHQWLLENRKVPNTPIALPCVTLSPIVPIIVLSSHFIVISLNFIVFSEHFKVLIVPLHVKIIDVCSGVPCGAVMIMVSSLCASMNDRRYTMTLVVYPCYSLDPRRRLLKTTLSSPGVRRRFAIVYDVATAMSPMASDAVTMLAKYIMV